MIKLIVKIRPEQEDICFYPKDFNRVKFLGLETDKGFRYCRNNWANSADNFAFWYPFVGGPSSSVFTTVHSETDIENLLGNGNSFYAFGSARELYLWMANGEMKNG